MATKTDAATVTEYLEGLEPERRAVLSKVRSVIKKNLPKGYREGMNFGAIVYEIPLDKSGKTYNGQPLCYVALAAQKNYNSLYLMSCYGHPGKLKDLKEGFKAAGKKLDMGKSCVRFKTLDDLPLDVIAESVASTSVDEFVAMADRTRAKGREGSAGTRASVQPAKPPRPRAKTQIEPAKLDPAPFNDILHGIGAKTEAALYRRGITTLQAIIETPGIELVEIMSMETVENVKAQARDILKGKISFSPEELLMWGTAARQRRAKLLVSRKK